MIKIFALHANENWICDSIVHDWNSHNSTIVTSNPIEADIIWLVASWLWYTIHPDILKQKKVVVTVHHIDNEKFNLQDFMNRDQYVDAYHVYDELTERKVKMLSNKPVYKIMYWYNPNNWSYPDVDCRADLNLPNDVKIIGSFQRDTEGFDLKTPKLSKGPDLFCDYVESLDNVRVLLGGWRRQYIINRLDKAGIPYNYFEMADRGTLIKMYKSCDLYVVSSRCEGGPQAVIEASLLKVPIASTDVGIASEVLHPECINTEAKFDNIEKYKKYVDFNYNNILNYNIEIQKQTYIEMFEYVKKAGKQLWTI